MHQHYRSIIISSGRHELQGRIMHLLWVSEIVSFCAYNQGYKSYLHLPVNACAVNCQHRLAPAELVVALKIFIYKSGPFRSKCSPCWAAWRNVKSKLGSDCGCPVQVFQEAEKRPPSLSCGLTQRQVTTILMFPKSRAPTTLIEVNGSSRCSAPWKSMPIAFAKGVGREWSYGPNPIPLYQPV